MEILFELPPLNRRFIDKVIEATRGTFNGYFIPCTPSGTPMLDCLTVSIYVLSKTPESTSIYCSLRTRDYSLNHILERALTASEMGLSGILITRGDPPLHGGCGGGDVCSTENVVDFIRRNGVRIRIGIVTSLRYPVEKIVERLMNVTPDFTTVIRFSKEDLEKLIEVRRIVGNIKIYVYLLIGVGRNIELFKQLNQPYIGLNELKTTLEDLEKIVDGVILSSPREIKVAIEAFSKNHS